MTTKSKTPFIGIYDKESTIRREIVKELNVEIEHIRGVAVHVIEEKIEIGEIKNPETYFYFFLIHLNRQGNQDYDGLVILKEVRTLYPDAFIVAYSAAKDKDVEADCRDYNAFFLEWSATDWDKIVYALKMILRVHLKIAQQTNNYILVNSYYCRIIDILEDSVLLHIENAKDRTQQTTRSYRRWRFNGIGIDKLRIDMPVLLRNYERFNEHDGSSEVKIIFTEGDASYYPEPEIDWAFFENRKVEVHKPKRRGQ